MVRFEELREFLYGKNPDDQKKTISSHIVSNIRKKLRNLSNGRFDISTWEKGGWYLSDAEHPELWYDKVRKPKSH